MQMGPGSQLHLMITDPPYGGHCLRYAGEQAGAILRTDKYLNKLFPDAEIEVLRTSKRQRAKTDETWLFFRALSALLCDL